MPKPRKLLVLLNPFSGIHLAEKNWSFALNILHKANLELDLIKTESQGHAYEIVKNIKVG